MLPSPIHLLLVYPGSAVPPAGLPDSAVPPAVVTWAVLYPTGVNLRAVLYPTGVNLRAVQYLSYC